MDTTRFPELIQSIYGAVDELESMFPGRHFTPDGHMVGSIGESIAGHYYGVKLHSASHEGHDGEAAGWQVQVKITQRKSIAITSAPEQLLVFRLCRDGTFIEEYNGPGKPVWVLVTMKPRPKNGQYKVSLSKLRELMASVPSSRKLRRIVQSKT